MKIGSRPNLDILKCIERVDAGWNDGAKNLLCPVCGFNYNHIEPPYLTDGNDDYAAGWGGRGDLAVVPMWGECGSKWEVCIGFHKGQSPIFVRVIESCEDKKRN